MHELEKILEEIDETIERYGKNPYIDEKVTDFCYGLNIAKDIIRKHMNDGWIPVEKELPPNAKHKGALCPRYQLMTKYGVTEGWYNPDYESWYVLCWFKGNDYPDYESWYVLCWSMGNDSLESEIDFERGTCHKLVRCENAVNDRQKIVLAWRPFPEPFRPERSEK